MNATVHFRGLGAPKREASVIPTREDTAEKYYDQLVSESRRRADPKKRELTAWDRDIWMAATMMAAEAAEVLDVIKKYVLDGSTPLNEVELIAEMGDTEYGMSMLRAALGISRERVCARNISKMIERRRTADEADLLREIEELNSK